MTVPRFRKMHCIVCVAIVVCCAEYHRLAEQQDLLEALSVQKPLLCNAANSTVQRRSSTYTCILQGVCMLREGSCPLLEPPLNAKSHCCVQGPNSPMHDVLGAVWLHHLDRGYCRVGVASVPNNSRRLCRRTSELSEALLLWSHSQSLTVYSYQFANFAMQVVAAYTRSLETEAASKVATALLLQCWHGLNQCCISRLVHH